MEPPTTSTVEEVFPAERDYNPEHRQLSEQQQIERYLQQFQLEACLDEILNQVVVQRPRNPYVAIAQAFESKTMPEILEVKLTPVFHRVGFAVRATVLTNIGPFFGTAVYSSAVSSADGLYEPKEYSVLDGKLTEALIPIDPRNLRQVDEAVAGMIGVDPAESLAVSIACCRAGAKFKAVKLYEHIADLCQNKDLCIPLPVPTVLVKTVAHTQAAQALQLFAVNSSSFEMTINKIFQFLHMLTQNEKIHKPVRFSPQGTAVLEGIAFEEMGKLVVAMAKDFESGNGLKLGLFMQQNQLQRQAENTFTYANEAGQQKSGAEVVESLLALWQEKDFVSVDSPLADMDIPSLRLLKKRANEVMQEVKTTKADKLKYCQRGVGGDSSCNLQVPVDGVHLDAHTSEIEKFLGDLPYNACRLSMHDLPSVSRALQIVEKARKFRLPVIVDTGSLCRVPRLGDQSILFPSPDDFDVDFCVGVGGVQLFGNGVYEMEFSARLNRLQDIAAESPSIRYTGTRFRGGV